MACKFCGEPTTGNWQAFCLGSDCRKFYNAKQAEKKKVVKKLSMEVKQSLSYIYNYLSNPTEQQIKDTCSYYNAPINIVRNNLHLRDICKHFPTTKREFWVPEYKRGYGKEKL